MVSEAELLIAVDAAFGVTGHGLRSWPDPHPDRSVRDEEYSRLTDPGRWRILGARVDAWLIALSDAGVAEVRRGVGVTWTAPPGPVISRADRVEPCTAGAVSFVVGRSHLGCVDDAGVVLGVGDPAVEVDRFPDCGCDACDSGSRDELDRLDAHVIGIVSGRFRRLARRDDVILTIGDGGWRCSGRRRPPEVAKVLADPRGWHELSGARWL